MTKFNKIALVAMISASTFVGSVSASTITNTSVVINGISVTFDDGVVANDGSGLTSENIQPGASLLQQVSTGFFIETFDEQTSGAATAASTAFNDVDSETDTCSINSLEGVNAGVTINASPSTDVLNVRSGTIPNVAASPANNDTCFGYVSNAGLSGASVNAEFDYTDLLLANSDTGITFFGFYWGSVDTFNDFSFFSGTDEVVTLTGTEILTQLSGVSGNQVADTSNVYVSLSFDLADAFDRVVLSTSGVAAEFDNIVIGLAQRPDPIPVPAPAGIALLAAGLLLVSARSRFKK